MYFKKSIPGVWNNIAGVKSDFSKDGINFDEVIKKQVGKGDNTLFSLDKWLFNENLKSLLPGLYKPEKSKKCKLRDRIDNGRVTWEWKSRPSSNS